MAKKNTVQTVIKARDEASKKFNKVGRAAGGMGKMIKGAAVAAGAYFGLRAIKNFAGSSITAFIEQEKSTKKLIAALRATGGAAGFTVKQLQKYADSLQNATAFGDETIETAMSVMATFRNIKGDEFLDATEAALDMSEALGADLQSTVIQLGKALNDPTTGISALNRVGVTFSDVQKEQIKNFIKTNDVAAAQKVILDELSNQFGGQAKEAASGFSGTVRQLANTWGDTKEQMGKFIADLPGLQAGLQSVQVILKNFGTAAKIASIQFKLFFIDLWEDTKHLFGSTIPELLQWFSQNWRDVFQTIWDGTKAIFVNMGKNIADFFKAVWSWMKGEGFDFTWTSLTEGFESSLKELPKILAREKTTIEKALAKQLGELELDLAGKIAAKWSGADAGIDRPTGDEAGEDIAKLAGGGKKSAKTLESRFLTLSTTKIEPTVEIVKSARQQVRLLNQIARTLEQQLNAEKYNSNKVQTIKVSRFT